MMRDPELVRFLFAAESQQPPTNQELPKSPGKLPGDPPGHRPQQQSRGHTAQGQTGQDPRISMQELQNPP